MRCPACDVEVVQQAVFCHKCGHCLDSQGETSAPNSVNVRKQMTVLEQDAQEPPEEELWRGGYSAKAMIGSWIVSGVFSLLIFIGGVLWARSTTWWLFVVILTVAPWAYNLIILCYRRMNVRYTLTTQRFIHESGILRRVNDRIEVLDMDDVTFEQGVVERLVGVGTIRIVSTDRCHPDFELPGIENVKTVAELLDNARRIERQRRGLHVEQI